MLFNTGALAGEFSGALGNVVASRNRSGAYFRARTIPITSTTSYALAAKARLSTISSAWASLTAAQQAAWFEWASNNPVLNRIGQTIILPGNAAYVQINTRLSQAGASLLSVPPVDPAPDGLQSLSLTADIGAGDVAVTYTPTPLGASERLWVWAAVVDSSGVNFVTNQLRLIRTGSPADASPIDIEANVTSRFGTLQVGQWLHVFCQVMDSDTGLVSQFQRARSIVTTT
jgi:hypothetical protein